jgi:hypothetical protein
MNYLYIVLLLAGIIIGMILEWYMVRSSIGDKKTVQIGKNKQKEGTGNIQDLELEMNQAEQGRTAKEIRQEHRAERREEREARKESKNELNKSNLKS